MTRTGGETARTGPGVLMVLGSAVAFSLAGVLTKAISADVWSIVSWRGLVGGFLIGAYLVLVTPASRRPAAFRLGRGGWLVAVVGSAASVAFIFSFKLTYVANVAVIYATVPLMTAALAWWWLRERVGVDTVVASALALVGVTIVVGGGIGTDRFVGDLVAVAMTLGNAAYMVLIRLNRRGAVIWAGAVSGLVLFPVGFILSDPLAISGRDMMLTVGFGGAWAMALILWTEGTKRLPAAESGLIGLAETPFAILLAWLVLSELPPVLALAGGSIVLVAVVGHAGRGARKARRSTPG
jgi:drug/metabolite transporter (DMT)-like permease